MRVVFFSFLFFSFFSFFVWLFPSTEIHFLFQLETRERERERERRKGNRYFIFLNSFSFFCVWFSLFRSIGSPVLVRFHFVVVVVVVVVVVEATRLSKNSVKPGKNLEE